MKYSFKNDYSEGTHPQILNAFLLDNRVQSEGYSLDEFCNTARKNICDNFADKDVDIHFLSGGTQTNMIFLTSALKDYEAIIAVNTGHINIHETGAIEYTGHKILTMDSADGKVNVAGIKAILDAHTDEHMVFPKIVFISNSTELGTIYSKPELTAISEFCKSNNLYLYLDGARLASALTSADSDLTLNNVNDLVDAFYIGGTKNGGMMGEALVIKNNNLKENFRFHLKQKGALPAKGRYFGIQFREFFKDNLYFELGKIANNFAKKLAEAITESGYKFLVQQQTNQLFPIFPIELIDKLYEEFDFYIWEKYEDNTASIRLVCSWATDENYFDKLIDRIKSF
jgi:threonine aldolase